MKYTLKYCNNISMLIFWVKIWFLYKMWYSVFIIKKVDWTLLLSNNGQDASVTSGDTVTLSFISSHKQKDYFQSLHRFHPKCIGNPIFCMWSNIIHNNILILLLNFILKILIPLYYCNIAKIQTIKILLKEQWYNTPFWT